MYDKLKVAIFLHVKWVKWVQINHDTYRASGCKLLNTIHIYSIFQSLFSFLFHSSGRDTISFPFLF